MITLYKNIRGALAPFLLGLTAMLAGCGGSDDSDGGIIPPGLSQCGVTNEKTFVTNQVKDWYLFLDLLPPNLNAANYSTADDLLDAYTATARQQGKDRYFSYLTSIEAEEQFFGDGESVGFGVSFLVVLPNRLFVSQVYDGSSAQANGFRRGDEITAIGETANSMTSVATLMAQQNGITTALGPTTSGVTRVLQVVAVTGGTTNRTVVKGEFDLDPVPTHSLLPRSGLAPVGYVNLRTFIQPADAPLRAAFAEFQSNNVRDVIIDLRYNGGGLVSIADLLINLLASNQTGKVMYRQLLNSKHTAEESTTSFTGVNQAIPALRIAFLTTDASASASELVINALSPYAEVAIVGGSTYGKPVGQYAFDMANCDTRLRLITFRLVNANNYGDYFLGLPSTTAQVPDAYCPASDDLTHEQGDATELMTKEALFWLTNAACQPTASAGLGKSGVVRTQSTSVLPLMLRKPDPVQVYQPGFF